MPTNLEDSERTRCSHTHMASVVLTLPSLESYEPLNLLGTALWSASPMGSEWPSTGTWLHPPLHKPDSHRQGSGTIEPCQACAPQGLIASQKVPRTACAGSVSSPGAPGMTPLHTLALPSQAEASSGRARGCGDGLCPFSLHRSGELGPEEASSQALPHPLPCRHTHTHTCKLMNKHGL